MQRTKLNVEEALEAIATIEEALESIKDSLETAVDEVDQQIEDGELDKSDRETAILEVMDGTSENLGLIRGTAAQLEGNLG